MRHLLGNYNNIEHRYAFTCNTFVSTLYCIVVYTLKLSIRYETQPSWCFYTRFRIKPAERASGFRAPHLDWLFMSVTYKEAMRLADNSSLAPV